LANVYYYEEKDDAALNYYTKAIEKESNLGLAYYGRAVIHKLNKQIDAALQDFQKYIDLNGNKDGLASEVERLMNEIRQDKLEMQE